MADPAPLVSADWLAERLGSPDVRIIDIRSAVDGGGEGAYLEAHVPGAVHTDYARHGWRTTRGMASGLLPEPEFLAQLLGSLGLAPSDHAIIVSAGTSAGDFSAAARVYWTLKVAGHGSVSLLDGGMAAWRGRPVEAGRQQPPSTGPYPVKLQSELRSDLAAVEAIVADKSAILLDSRSEGFFFGRDKSPQALRAGRLPQARHVDHALAFDPETRRLLPKAELEALFAGVPDKPVVNFCNTGHQAATNWFVLSEILHRPSTLYDGSMSEWTEDPSRPVETG